MLDKLFKFPITLIDGETEERKVNKANDLAMDSTEVDMIFGEAECPYYDFLSVSDRWLPTTESLGLAMEGTFEACLVTFSSSGQYIVPWNKERFKRELKKFIDSVPKEPNVQFSILNPEIFKRIPDEEGNEEDNG